MFSVYYTNSKKQAREYCRSRRVCGVSPISPPRLSLRGLIKNNKIKNEETAMEQKQYWLGLPKHLFWGFYAIAIFMSGDGFEMAFYQNILLI